MSNIVAKRLKIIRNSLNYSQEDFAKYLKVSLRSYEKWEQGIRVPALSNLIKIADKLDINIDFLLGRTDVIITVINYKNIDKYFKQTKEDNNGWFKR
ncbi:helix-turn-helix transcriptional regulator [Tissierella praeacuta]|uniref:helix-turn-helix domain-containing protein n=1 Tax=Tissierella praeacuta TaxID=43131 RepID=UPI00333F6DD2